MRRRGVREQRHAVVPRASETGEVWVPFRVTLWKSPLSPSAAPMVDAHALTQNGIEPDLFPLETGEREPDSKSLVIVVASFLFHFKRTFHFLLRRFIRLEKAYSSRIVDVNWTSANEATERGGAEATKMKPK